MSEFKTDAFPSGAPPQLLDSVQHGGHLRIDVAKVKLSAASAANDTIKVMTLPPRSKLIPRLCRADGGAANVNVELVGYTDAAAFPAAGINFTAKRADEAIQNTETVLVAKLTGTGTIPKDTELVFSIVYCAF